MKRIARRRIGWMLFLSFIAVPGVVAAGYSSPQSAKAAEPAPAQKSIRPEPALAGPTWDGSQFVRADRKGKIFLFRGNTFQVYPQTADGTLGEPAQLESFLVTRPDGALVLDRYDPALAVLERVPLDVTKKSSRFTLASGKDGLYLAAWNGRDGRWRIPWEILEKADWQKVEEAEIRGGSNSKSAG